MPGVPFRGAITNVSDRAMMARIHVLGIRKHPNSAWALEIYEHVRRDLCGIYTETETDAYEDAGRRMMPMLPTQEIDFVTATAPTATHGGVWPSHHHLDDRRAPAGRVLIPERRDSRRRVGALRRAGLGDILDAED